MIKDKKKGLKWIATALVLGVAAILAWERYGAKEDDRLASGNGRIEATEIDVAAKIAGRIKEILVRLEADDDQARVETGSAAIAAARAQVAAAEAAIITARVSFAADVV